MSRCPSGPREGMTSSSISGYSSVRSVPSTCSSESERGTIPFSDQDDLRRVICKYGRHCGEPSAPISGESVVIARATINELISEIQKDPSITHDPEFIARVVCLNEVIISISAVLPIELIVQMDNLYDLSQVS